MAHPASLALRISRARTPRSIRRRVRIPKACVNSSDLKYDLDMIYLAGPGHGAPGVLGPAYLEGTYSEIYPEKSQDPEGLREFFRSEIRLGHDLPRWPRPWRTRRPWPCVSRGHVLRDLSGEESGSRRPA